MVKKGFLWDNQRNLYREYILDNIMKLRLMFWEGNNVIVIKLVKCFYLLEMTGGMRGYYVIDGQMERDGLIKLKIFRN